MNCKFCNNFIPDGSKICPVCGKDVTETALVVDRGSQAITTPLAPEEQPVQTQTITYVKKSLTAPVIILLIGLAALAYLFLPFAPCLNAAEKIKNGFNSAAIDNQTSDDNPASADLSSTNNEQNWTELGVTCGGTALGAAVAIGGGAMTGKRAKTNSKIRKLEKSSKR